MTDSLPTISTELAPEDPDHDVVAMYIAHVKRDDEIRATAGVISIRKSDPTIEGIEAAKDELIARMRARGELA